MEINGLKKISLLIVRQSIAFALLFIITANAFPQIPDFGRESIEKSASKMDFALAMSDIDLKENQLGKLKMDDCSFIVSTRKVFFDSESIIMKKVGINSFIVLEFKSAFCDDKLFSMEHWNLGLELARPIRSGDKVPIPTIVMHLVRERLKRND